MSDDNEKMVELIFDGADDVQNMCLPTPELLNYYKLRTRRILFLNPCVDETMSTDVQNILLWNLEDINIPPKNREPIIIYLMNFGGSINYTWMMVDTILQSKTPIYTVNLNQSASGGALIFLAGHKRYMMPHATVMIHNGSIEINGDMGKVLDNTEDCKREIKEMYNYIESRTNIDHKLLNKKKNNDWIINAEECIKYGITNKIINNIDEVL